MMDQHQKAPYRSTPSPYLYDVDPSLHASQKPSEVPRVKRNLVQNLVDKFNEEAKRRELYRHHSVDDSLMRNYDVIDHHHHNHRSPTSAGVIEANADNAPNHNHPFSYATPSSLTTSTKNKINNKMSTQRNGGLASQRQYRSDYNIGPAASTMIHRQQPASEIIYAHVKSSTDNKAGKRIKTTVHTKVPNRSVADSKSKSFAKSTGSLNMSAHVEDLEAENVDDQAKIKHQKNGNYYRYAEVDENIREQDRRGRRINKAGGTIVDNRLQAATSGIKDIAEPLPATPAYETRNVERWSENEVKPNSRKFTEHEYVHEVSVNKSTGGGGGSRPLIPKEDYFPIKDRTASTSSSTRLQQQILSDPDEMAKIKWPHSLRRHNKDTNNIGSPRTWIKDDDVRLTSDVKRYYFGGEAEAAAAPEKPPRQKWMTTSSSSQRLRRNSEESAASSGVGLLSSKLVKKANERFGGGGYLSGEPDTLMSRRRRVSEGDSDVFPPVGHHSSSNWGLLERNANDDDILGPHHNGYTEESRKVIRRKEETTHTRQRTSRTTRHHSPSDIADGHRGRSTGIDEVDDHHHSGSLGRRRVDKSRQAEVLHQQNGIKSPLSNNNNNTNNNVSGRTSKQVIQERSSSATRRHHHQQASATNKNASFDVEDRMETSESEQPLYGGSQESRMSLGSRLSTSADEEASNVDNVHTPQSVVRQLNKRQINYENSQQHHHQTSSTSNNTGNTGRRFWFERNNDVNTTSDIDRRNNNINNNGDGGGGQWTSATLSRLETNKNHRNGSAGMGLDQDRRWASNTVDRRGHRSKAGNEIRIQVNDRDVIDGDKSAARAVDRSSSFNSRVGSYHSENDELSQGSGGSSTSAKSPKRVNFKSKSKSANLSPVHREALLRSASPARAPSVAGSLKSNDSDVSHVILHATAVADIPPTRQYRLRSANTSPSPPASSIGVGSGNNKRKESRTVHRSFSLLAPWKPRKYKEKYESTQSSGKLSATNGSAPNLHRDDDFDDHDREAKVEKKRHPTSSAGGSPQVRFKKTTTSSSDRSPTDAAASRDSSSEKLDSLSPLPSESANKSSKKKSASSKKKSGLLRRHSMPKDSRFANFFRRKKDKEPKK